MAFLSKGWICPVGGVAFIKGLVNTVKNMYGCQENFTVGP